ncbi:Eukaryotic translation initiation factor 2 subunit alpha [Carex littledalei]|uniref:Eukaryotic translation initiation factor 2 subunit alpha n=1 Tax=Carex littledalei TaxID=544730 RepID=A0A833VGP4_9POAL|nr:Eukaryotic translation initiation factor 2 subunit alpha [Carex littledalei]
MERPNLECRMYESKYPEQNTVVMVHTSGVSEIGTSVSLLEYNNIEGLIFFNDNNTNCPHRNRSFTSFIKCYFAQTPVFQAEPMEPAYVLRVQREKGCVYLSKKWVSEDAAKACKKRYYKSKLVHFIMRQVAENLSIDLEDVYTAIGWPLYRKYGHAFNAFKLIAHNPDPILNSLTNEIVEVGPDGEEVTKVEPAVTVEMKHALVKSIRNFIEIIGDCSCAFAFRFKGI